MSLVAVSFYDSPPISWYIKTEFPQPFMLHWPCSSYEQLYFFCLTFGIFCMLSCSLGHTPDFIRMIPRHSVSSNSNAIGAPRGPSNPFSSWRGICSFFGTTAASTPWHSLSNAVFLYLTEFCTLRWFILDLHIVIAGSAMGFGSRMFKDYFLNEFWGEVSALASAMASIYSIHNLLFSGSPL